MMKWSSEEKIGTHLLIRLTEECFTRYIEDCVFLLNINLQVMYCTMNAKTDSFPVSREYLFHTQLLNLNL